MVADHKVEQVTLSSIAGGAAEELFHAALQAVKANIEDPNTSHKDKRQIALVFNITVDEDRRVGNVEILCQTKVAGVKGVNVGVYFGRHHGELVAVEAPRQVCMFPTPESRPRPVPAMTADGGTD